MTPETDEEFAEAATQFMRDRLGTISPEEQRAATTRTNMLSDLDSYVDATMALDDIRKDPRALPEEVFARAQTFRQAEQKMNTSIGAYVKALEAVKRKERRI
jgi:hypothetical protein